MAVAAYPAMLHPEVARTWHRAWQGIRSSVRDGEIAQVWRDARTEARLVVEHPELAEALHKARTGSSDEA